MPRNVARREVDMSSSPDDFALSACLSACKCQLDAAMRVAEAIVEGAEHAREIQLQAGVDAHAWLEANRKSLAAVGSPAELFALQAFIYKQWLDSLKWRSRAGSTTTTAPT
jgi:hypothetical protein